MNVADEIKTIGEILRTARHLPWENALYVVGNGPWAESDPCAVLDPEDSEEPGEIPPAFAAKHGLRYILNFASVQDIVSNAEQQIRNPSMELLLLAFNYYVEFDAFIDFTSKE